MSLTEKELNVIGEQIRAEKMLICKYKAYVLICEDPELRQKCESIAGKHQTHFERLINFLN